MLALDDHLLLPDGDCCRCQGSCEPTAGGGSACRRWPSPRAPQRYGELCNKRKDKIKMRSEMNAAENAAQFVDRSIY